MPGLRSRFDRIWRQARPRDPVGGRIHRGVWRGIEQSLLEVLANPGHRFPDASAVLAKDGVVYEAWVRSGNGPFDWSWEVIDFYPPDPDPPAGGETEDPPGIEGGGSSPPVDGKTDDGGPGPTVDPPASPGDPEDGGPLPGDTGPFFGTSLGDLLDDMFLDFPSWDGGTGLDDPFSEDATQFPDAEDQPSEDDDPRPDVGQDSHPTLPPDTGGDTSEPVLAYFNPYLVPLVVTQFDGPEPGPADVVALEIAIDIWLLYELWNIYDDLVEGPESSKKVSCTASGYIRLCPEAAGPFSGDSTGADCQTCCASANRVVRASQALPAGCSWGHFQCKCPK